MQMGYLSESEFFISLAIVAIFLKAIERFIK